MIFQKKPPTWDNPGIEPGEDLKKEGFRAGYKPPAAYFNWLFHGLFESVTEIQEEIDEITVEDLDALDDTGGEQVEPEGVITDAEIDIMLQA